MLHPYTVGGNPISPTDHDQLSDANVTTHGNSYELIVAEHDRAEADYAALAMAGDEADLARELAVQADVAAMEDDRQANDEATTENELWNVYDRYGREALDRVVQNVEQRISDRLNAKLRKSTDNLLQAFREILSDEPAGSMVPILSASLAFEQAKRQPDRTPAA